MLIWQAATVCYIDLLLVVTLPRDSYSTTNLCKNTRSGNEKNAQLNLFSLGISLLRSVFLPSL
jgi:hypothetical protein